jgi:hypothetical protein
VGVGGRSGQAEVVEVQGWRPERGRQMQRGSGWQAWPDLILCPLWASKHLSLEVEGGRGQQKGMALAPRYQPSPLPAQKPPALPLPHPLLSVSKAGFFLLWPPPLPLDPRPPASSWPLVHPPPGHGSTFYTVTSSAHRPTVAPQHPRQPGLPLRPPVPPHMASRELCPMPCRGYRFCHGLATFVALCVHLSHHQNTPEYKVRA